MMQSLLLRKGGIGEACVGGLVVLNLNFVNCQVHGNQNPHGLGKTEMLSFPFTFGI